MRTLELVQTALLIALCAGIGHLLALVPNVELISAAVFVCGLLTGIRRGLVIGAMSALLYFGFNVNGVAPPPLLAAQGLGLALVGGGGGILRSTGWHRHWLACGVASAVAGFVLTLVFDLLTNSAGYLMVREGVGYFAWLVAGLSFPFPLAHVLLNTLSFAVVTPAVYGAVSRWGQA